MTTAEAIATIVVIIAALTGALLLLPKMARPTLPFGVRVPADRTNDLVITTATRQYYRWLIVTMAVVTVVLVALAFVVPTPVAVSSTAFVALAAWFVPYLSARRLVLDAKHTETWFEGKQQAVVADTSWRASPPPYPWKWALPAIFTAVATLIVGIVVYPSLPDRIATHVGPNGPDEFTDTTVWSAFALVGVQFLLTALLLGIVWVVLRSKPDLAASDPKASAHQYRRYAIAMAKSVLVVAFGMNVTMLLAALVVWDVLPHTTVWIVVSIVPALVTAGVAVAVAIRTGQSGHRLHTTTTASSATADRDDDAYWIAGLIYRNPDDPALWVPKRYGGVGWTINLARPTAWIFIGALVAIVIGTAIIAALA